jgi:hypothetical protein
MGVSLKTLSRLVSLHDHGLLKDGASIIELGAQQLFCSGMEAQIADVIRHFSASNPAVRPVDELRREELTAMADGGLFGRLARACGFSYRALDIFEAENTTLFDLNFQEPGPELRESFDLVTNFGTTEHVLNQYLSMKTVHELARPGGLIYHDLPLAGYHNHGYFSYNPLLFQQLADANGYKVIMQHYSRSAAGTPTPPFMRGNGYPEATYLDFGIEFIFQKVSSAPFRAPLETSTSLAVSDSIRGDGAPYGAPAGGADAVFHPEGSRSLAHVSGWDLQRELLSRYRRQFLALLGRR